MANTPLFSIFKVIYCILFSLFLTVIMYSIFTVFITIHFIIVNSNQRSDDNDLGIFFFFEINLRKKYSNIFKRVSSY